jgi:hypothetical protein
MLKEGERKKDRKKGNKKERNCSIRIKKESDTWKGRNKIKCK